MKAVSPVRSSRKPSGGDVVRGLSDQSLGISRGKAPVEEPLGLLYNMNDCYSKLRELVPSIPQNKKVSKMEILQHVIDYILDLQIALDTHPASAIVIHQPPGQGSPSRTPLSTLNTDVAILSLQASEFPKQLLTDDSKALCR
ncbi:DNA-binding protein inhibitor ID-2a [Callorhinchus milii]|uniref:DNA-binding protein inhibitor ID-4 n=1 Tax=Callorhinchus milii TaxID=7868 RepID=V9L3G7_CALMI|nr:DNA-binding protein inhibitor ID-2a [Callorhinchus milii]|eukprot:gi/632976190/ref/XP_007904657.1/ PREDICTED: DNA-binding protein inhibitor ID-2 [Callorhinchus milii]